MIKTITYIFLIIVVIFSVSTFVFWLKIKTPINSAADGTVIFKVERGQSAETIAENLKNAGLIKNPFIFRLYVYLALGQYALKSGEYEFSPAMQIRDMADAIVIGGTNEVLITIPEGFTLAQIEDRLVAAKLAEKGEIVNFRFTAPPAIFSDKPKTASLEGYLFPDTYRFFKDAALSDIISKMVANLDDKLTSDLKDAVKKSNRATYEILTMASLIEKEVKSDVDRKLVSGILWKRLEAKIPLQVDATLVYITGRKEISDADKKINSPYNTYYYRGLPKGPIANPGLSAIKAAIFPQSSPYWYYLSAKDGMTIFSKTLEEHNSNKAKYLR